MKILHYPDKHLRTSTNAIIKITPEVIQQAQEMYKVMRDANGLGLAANQVGLDISLIVLEDNGKPLMMFNPTILKRSKEQEYGAEGCLSFPNIFRNLKRPIEVTVKYRDINNKMQYRTLQGIQARAMIHEYEHLSGKLFIDVPEREQYDKTTS